MSRSFSENFDRLIEVERLDRTEGPKGVENLAKLVHFMGYEDFQRYGQIRGGAALGDILEFLEDNPGAIEALHNWIRDQGSDGDSWDEAISAQLGEAEALEAIETLSTDNCVKLLRETGNEDDESLDGTTIDDLRRLVKMSLEDGDIDADTIMELVEKSEESV
jgi:hypothetical protein